MKLWDGARQEVENAYFERSADPQVRANVLADPVVNKAAKELGMGSEEIERLTNALMKFMILEDRRELTAQLTDADGERKPKMEELAAVVDRALMRESAKALKGGADFEPPERVEPQADRNVQAFLNQNPQVVQVLNSAQFQQLAQNMQLPVEQVVQAYLSRVQAELNPVLAAEFNGRLEAGDLATKQTLDISDAVIGLIQQQTGPSEEVVNQQLEQSMQGDVVKSILEDPNTQARAEQLGVDAEQTMRMILTAEFSGDVTPLAKLEEQARAGSAVAKGQLELIQTLSQDLVAISQQVAAQAQQGAAPAA
jgi:NACalpha-BTF3-like transcription factor